MAAVPVTQSLLEAFPAEILVEITIRILDPALPYKVRNVRGWLLACKTTHAMVRSEIARWWERQMQETALPAIANWDGYAPLAPLFDLMGDVPGKRLIYQDIGGTPISPAQWTQIGEWANVDVSHWARRFQRFEEAWDAFAALEEAGNSYGPYFFTPPIRSVKAHWSLGRAIMQAWVAASWQRALAWLLVMPRDTTNASECFEVMNIVLRRVLHRTMEAPVDQFLYYTVDAATGREEFSPHTAEVMAAVNGNGQGTREDLCIGYNELVRAGPFYLGMEAEEYPTLAELVPGTFIYDEEGQCSPILAGMAAAFQHKAPTDAFDWATVLPYARNCQMRCIYDALPTMTDDALAQRFDLLPREDYKTFRVMQGEEGPPPV